MLSDCDPAAAPWLSLVSYCICAAVLLQIKRTEGVSTTDIVGRMLTCTRVNPHMNKAQDNASIDAAAWQRAVCWLLIVAMMWLRQHGISKHALLHIMTQAELQAAKKTRRRGHAQLLTSSTVVTA
jgi:hypothetical protein